MADYIHERRDWPEFRWNRQHLDQSLAAIRYRQGRLLGRMEAQGLLVRKDAVLATLTQDVIKSSEIEGEHLDLPQVRSSIARRLGMDAAGLKHPDRLVEGVVDMMLDATQRYQVELTPGRLFGWHASLFPEGRSGVSAITTGRWRTDESGPMQAVSGPIGRSKVHFEAPSADRLKAEMDRFIDWFKSEQALDPVIKAAVAHLWFVTVHPFDDGNGRIARAISDLQLARSEGTSQRFYSMSAQIRLERRDYYDVLEQTQKGDLDITAWVQWFLGCLDRAFIGAEAILSGVLRKSEFWKLFAAQSFNDRQRKVVNLLIDGFEGKLTSSKWAALTKTSQDTAGRDISDLLKRGILSRNAEGGRSTSYFLAALPEV